MYIAKRSPQLLSLSLSFCLSSHAARHRPAELYCIVMAASTQQGTRSMLHLYRQILKNAMVFPSRGREGMIKEIRQEFRVNAKETDPDKIKKQRELAIKGLSQLQAYTGLSYDDANWSVNLEQAPLGAMSDEHYEEKMKSRGAEAIVIEAKKVDPE